MESGSGESEAWAALFSGGKDSSWALHRALKDGYAVSRLVTVHPSPGSYMYHVPATELAPLAAESIGIPLVEVDTGDLEATGPVDAEEQGDRELQPLESALHHLTRTHDGGIDGLVAGAVESAFQTNRLRSLCDRLDVELWAPLHGSSAERLAEAMLDAGFEIRIVAVAADGLDEEWLGRELDSEAFAELEQLNETKGVLPLGEGGEFETIVTDGPHMDRSIRFDADPVWDGVRGELAIRDAWLE